MVLKVCELGCVCVCVVTKDMATVNDHPPDCECCVNVRFTPGARGGSRKRTREDADLSTFLPEDAEPPEEGEEEGEGEEEEAQGEERLLSSALFASFDAHVLAIDAARKRRRQMLTFRSAAEEDGQTEEVSADATQDEIDGLGVWLPTDTMQGDVNMRTLEKLLKRVDQRGFERSAQQLEFHVAFMKAAARVIYRGSWETERPAIMRKYGWDKSNSEVLISTPRRFGKTFRRVPQPPRPLLRAHSRYARALQHCDFLRVPLTRLRPGGGCVQPSPTCVSKVARKDRGICATRRRRQAHLRVQPGGLPFKRLRRP